MAPKIVGYATVVEEIQLAKENRWRNVIIETI